MKGIDYISNPSFNTATNKQIIFIGVPLYENGNIVAAMTCTFDSSYLSELVSSITYMGEGSTYMLSSDGTVVESKNMDDVLNSYNVIQAAAEDSSLAGEAEITQTMISGDSGSLTYNKCKYFYTKVEGSNGWTVFLKLDESVYKKEIKSLIVFFIVFGVIGIAVVVVISLLIGDSLGKRLNKLKNNLEQVADGDFTLELEDFIYSI